MFAVNHSTFEKRTAQSFVVLANGCVTSVNGSTFASGELIANIQSLADDANVVIAKSLGYALHPQKWGSAILSDNRARTIVIWKAPAFEIPSAEVVLRRAEIQCADQAKDADQGKEVDVARKKHDSTKLLYEFHRASDGEHLKSNPADSEPIPSDRILQVVDSMCGATPRPKLDELARRLRVEVSARFPSRIWHVAAAGVDDVTSIEPAIDEVGFFSQRAFFGCSGFTFCGSLTNRDVWVCHYPATKVLVVVSADRGVPQASLRPSFVFKRVSTAVRSLAHGMASTAQKLGYRFMLASIASVALLAMLVWQWVSYTQKVSNSKQVGTPSYLSSSSVMMRLSITAVVVLVFYRTYSTLSRYYSMRMKSVGSDAREKKSS